EPDQMTEAEKKVLAARGLTGVRLSCQILCDHDMTVKCISRLAGSGRKDAGSRPADEITPPPGWVPKGEGSRDSVLVPQRKAQHAFPNLACRASAADSGPRGVLRVPALA